MTPTISNDLIIADAIGELGLTLLSCHFLPKNKIHSCVVLTQPTEILNPYLSCASELTFNSDYYAIGHTIIEDVGEVELVELHALFSYLRNTNEFQYVFDGHIYMESNFMEIVQELLLVKSDVNPRPENEEDIWCSIGAKIAQLYLRYC